MNITHVQKKINVLENTALQDNSNNGSIGLVITEDDNLWEDLLLLAATVKLTLRRGSSFHIWKYWNDKFPLFLEMDFATQLPGYWKRRPNLWIVFTESQRKKHQTQIIRLPVAQYIVLPTEITDFITRFSGENEGSLISAPGIGAVLSESLQSESLLKLEAKNVFIGRSDIESIGIMGAQGGAGVSLFAFIAAYIISKSQDVLYVDVDGNCNAISIGVEEIPLVSPLYRDSTSVASQIMASYPRSTLGFHLADGTQAFHTEIEFQNFMRKLSDLKIFTVFDLGKFSVSTIQAWCLGNCGKILLISQGYPQSAILIYKARKLYPQLNFIVIVVGKFRCGLNQALFEQLAQTTINKILPWDARLNLSYHSEKLKITLGFLKQVSMIIGQEND